MNIINALQIPTTKLDWFIRSVEVAAYIPGRVRLRSRQLVDNPALEIEVQAQLGAFPELTQVETSTATGSILIHYEPEVLRRNAELRKVEEYIMTHVQRR